MRTVLQRPHVKTPPTRASIQPAWIQTKPTLHSHTLNTRDTVWIQTWILLLCLKGPACTVAEQQSSIKFTVDFHGGEKMLLGYFIISWAAAPAETQTDGFLLMD